MFLIPSLVLCCLRCCYVLVRQSERHENRFPILRTNKETPLFVGRSPAPRMDISQWEDLRHGLTTNDTLTPELNTQGF